MNIERIAEADAPPAPATVSRGPGRALIPLGAALCFAPFMSTGLGLLLGLALALSVGNPYLVRTRKVTSTLLALAVVGLGAGMDLRVVARVGAHGILYTLTGIVTALHYSAALDTPANKKFVEAYQAKYSQVPSYYSEGTYVSCLALEKALESASGDVEDREKLVAALRKVDLGSAPRGPIKIDTYGNPVENVYVRKVEKVNGKLQNTVIHTFPMVSQFWTYKPEEFLKNAVYSRDFPPCTHCQK